MLMGRYVNGNDVVGGLVSLSRVLLLKRNNALLIKYPSMHYLLHVLLSSGWTMHPVWHSKMYLFIDNYLGA